MKNIRAFTTLGQKLGGVMELETNTFKYQRHGEKQLTLILSTAEQLFVENGVDKVSLTDIARGCGIMRSTFYRYFTNKEEIIWTILHRNAVELSQKIENQFKKTDGTAYSRFAAYLDLLYQDYVAHPQQYTFIDLMFADYQTATSEGGTPLYNRYFPEGEFRTGDTVRLLTAHFDDGSLKPGLEAKKTAVSVIYAAWGIVNSLSHQTKTLPAKYGITTGEVVRTAFDALLASIKA